MQFLNLTLGGLSSGAVYAAVALALILIWRATRIVNFAQGGMLMLTTFLAYTIVSDGGSYWLALAAAVLAGLVFGAVVERVLIRRIEGKPEINAVVVTFGLLVLLEGIAGMIFGGTPKSYPPAFGIRGFIVNGQALLFAPNDLWIILVTLAVMAVLAYVFIKTPLGLRMRSSAFAPEVARLLGVRVGRMFTLGWALAAAVGALAGVLIAPATFVGPNQFDGVLVFGFTAAVIGGLDSPVGGVVGGVGLGVVLSWFSGYFGSDIENLGALILLVLVLMIRPNGLFGAKTGRRV